MLHANLTPSRIGTITSLKTTISYFGMLCVVFVAAAGGICWLDMLAATVSSHAAAAQRRLGVDSSIGVLPWEYLSI